MPKIVIYEVDVDFDFLVHDMEWIKSASDSQTSCSEYRIDWGAFTVVTFS